MDAGSSTAAGVGASSGWGPEDLTVVIPTRDRWPLLRRTLDALAAQRVQGFEVLVVADGEDQRPPDLPGTRVVVQPHTGPGGARNHGSRLAQRPLVLFLGDDMVPVPTLVEAHLAQHRAHPGEHVAVLGRAEWHPEAAAGRLQHWLAWSGTQFDFGGITGDDAGWGRFYSCNVSLHRSFFLDAGGFDEDFTYYYEDLDCGWRLHQKGMELRYEPGALAHHLHRYDLAGLQRRFLGVGMGERMMAAKHAWFEPWFLARIRPAAVRPTPWPLWPLVADRLAARPGALSSRVRARADRWYLHRLAPSFLAGWAAEGDRAELQAYLGDAYDPAVLRGHAAAVDAERDLAGDEETFYRTSRTYLYDLTAFAMSGTKAPYLAELRALVPRRARLLDYGCGIGADGLRLLEDGYQVAFADFDNPSTAYLRWRLARRGAEAPVFDLDADEIPGGYHCAYSFDVIEHVEDPFDFLARLEARAGLVAVNLLEEEPDDTDLHRPLPIPAILDHAARRGLVRYRRYHGRSHLVIYRSSGGPAPSGPAPSRWQSLVERRLGSRLPGRAGWFPVPDA